jgi:hypothetical protein
MRIAVLVSVCLFGGCASDRLATAPPAGVDLSGHWRLDEAESDDAQRLMQSQLTAATATNGGGQSGSSGRRRQGPVGPQGPLGPVMPSVSLLAEGLRWPGKNLSIKQGGGSIEFSGDGSVRQCSTHETKAHPSPTPSRGRGDAPPPRCGWDDKTLVVESGETDEDRPPYDQRFSLSTDGERLIEVVTFKIGASSGFTASRVWERAERPPSANPPAAGGGSR